MRGFQFMLAGEVFRARYRHGYDKPEPLVPGEVTAYASRCGIAITPSRPVTASCANPKHLVPIIDRNPQHYVPSIYQAVQSDFQAATQSVYRSARFPSHVTLPVNTRPQSHFPRAWLSNELVGRCRWSAAE